MAANRREPIAGDEPGGPGRPPGDRPAASTYRDLALTFLRLGATAFGGPAAHIALGSLVLLLRFRVNSSWLVLGGAVVGPFLAAVP